MTVTSVDEDPQALTLTITSHHPAPVDRVWRVWDDPRLLERWWGPPTYPATVTTHDLTAGGRVEYVMTGPEGDTHGGYWDVTAVHAPTELTFRDGFADAPGTPDPDLPVTETRVTLTAEPDGGTRMTIVSHFPSADAMAQLVAMGMAEGMGLAVGQIDGLLVTRDA